MTKRPKFLGRGRMLKSRNSELESRATKIKKNAREKKRAKKEKLKGDAFYYIHIILSDSIIPPECYGIFFDVSVTLFLRNVQITDDGVVYFDALV